MPSTAPSAALVDAARRARAGDAEGFRALVEGASERLFRVAAHMLGDRDEADDVVQETFIRAWSRIGELRDPEAAIGWLVGVARNAARDRLRARRRRGERRDPAEGRAAERVADPAADPEQGLASAQLAAAVRRALGSLGEDHRLVLLLREVDGMSYEELAEVLSIKVGTVESRLFRARAKLTRRLEQMRRAGELS